MAKKKAKEGATKQVELHSHNPKGGKGSKDKEGDGKLKLGFLSSKKHADANEKKARHLSAKQKKS